MRALRQFSGCAALAIAAATAAPSFAQDVSTGAPDGPNVDTRDNVIIVTAQKREENIQTVPLAVTAIGGRDIPEGITEIAGLQGRVPSAQFLTNQNNTMNVSIRGISTNNVQIVGDPAISYNYNGVPITHSLAQPGGLFDLERIEVLRGPQGTIYGRNSTGGAVNIITARPDLSGVDAAFSTTVGNYDLVDVAGMINIPLTANLALRAVAQQVDRDGYTDDGFNDQNTRSARISALYDNGTNLSVLVGVDYTKQNSKGAAFTPCPPGADQVGPALPPLIGNYCVGYDWDPFAGGPTDQHTDQNFFQLENIGVHAEVALDLPFATLTYIPSYRYLTSESLGYSISTFQTAFTGGDYVHTGLRIFDDRNEVQSHELRLNSQGESKMQWVFGAYYLDDYIKDFRDSETNLPIFGPAAATGMRVFAEERKELTTESYAFFGQVTYPILDFLRLTGGARYTKDKRLSAGETRVIQSNGSVVPVPGDGELNYEKVTWRAGFDADIAEHSFLFGSVSTGYKSGGFNPGVQPSLYPPETVTAYELGIKNSLADGALLLNLTGFYNEYDNYQFSFFGAIQVPNPGVPGAMVTLQQQLTVPAEKARMYGGELEAVYNFSRDTRLDLNVNYLNARFTDFSYAGVDYSGNRIPFTPAWTVNVGLEHEFDLQDAGSLTAEVRSTFASAQRTYYYDAAGSIQDSQTRSNLSLTWRNALETLSASLWVRNIEDEPVIVQYLTQSPLNPTVALIAAPRTFGLTLSFNYK